jgi:hypothetical protein
MAVTTPVTAALEAHREYEEAEGRVRAAESDRDDARGRLDDALARAGWIRSPVVTAPGVGMYRHKHGSTTTEFNEVISVLQWEASTQS